MRGPAGAGEQAGDPPCGWLSPPGAGAGARWPSRVARSTGPRSSRQPAPGACGLRNRERARKTYWGTRFRLGLLSDRLGVPARVTPVPSRGTCNCPQELQPPSRPPDHCKWKTPVDTRWRLHGALRSGGACCCGGGSPLALRGRKLGWWGGDPGGRRAPGRAAQGMHAAVIGDWRKAQWRKATRDGVPAWARAPSLPPPQGRAGPLPGQGGLARAREAAQEVEVPAEAAPAMGGPSRGRRGRGPWWRRRRPHAQPPEGFQQTLLLHGPEAPWPESGSGRPRLFSWLSGHVMDAGAALGASPSFPAPTREGASPPAQRRPGGPASGVPPVPNVCTPFCTSPRCPHSRVQSPAHRHKELRALSPP